MVLRRYPGENLTETFHSLSCIGTAANVVVFMRKNISPPHPGTERLCAWTMAQAG